MPRGKDTRGRIREVPEPGEGSERKKFTKSRDRKAARQKPAKSKPTKQSGEDFRETHEGTSPQGPRSEKEGERHRRHAEQSGQRGSRRAQQGRRKRTDMPKNT